MVFMEDKEILDRIEAQYKELAGKIDTKIDNLSLKIDSLSQEKNQAHNSIFKRLTIIETKLFLVYGGIGSILITVIGAMVYGVI